MKRQTRKRIIEAATEIQSPQVTDSVSTSELAPDSQAICVNTPQTIAAEQGNSPVTTLSTTPQPIPQRHIAYQESMSVAELTGTYQQVTEENTQLAVVENNRYTTEGKLLGGITGKGFLPGVCPNPGGRPKKKPITEAYERLMSKPEFMQLVEQSVLAQLRKGSMVSAFQLKEMTDRVEGRVTEKVELGGELALGIAERMLRARNRNTG